MMVWWLYTPCTCQPCDSFSASVYRCLANAATAFYTLPAKLNVLESLSLAIKGCYKDSYYDTLRLCLSVFFVSNAQPPSTIPCLPRLTALHACKASILAVVKLTSRKRKIAPVCRCLCFKVNEISIGRVWSLGIRCVCWSQRRGASADFGHKFDAVSLLHSEFG